MSTPQTPSLEARVAALEASTNGREVRLTEGVERLTEEASGLNSLLHRVDDQQRALTDLQRRTTTSETRADEALTSMQAFRKSVIARTITIALVLSGLILATGAGLYALQETRQDNAARICTERNQGATLVQQYVKDQTATIQADPGRTPEIKQREISALTNLGRSFPVVDCNNDGIPG